MRVAGFVMVDEAGKPLAVSVGGGQTLAKALAPDSAKEMAGEHKRLVKVLRSPSHADDKEEADKQEAELREYEDAAGKGDPDESEGFDHPHVVGKVDSHKVIKGNREAKGDGDPTHPDTSTIGFAGREYAPTGKTGKSVHDQTPVHEFEAEDGHRVWADKRGRVHAGSTSEVERLRKLAAQGGAPDDGEAAKDDAPPAKGKQMTKALIFGAAGSLVGLTARRP